MNEDRLRDLFEQVTELAPEEQTNFIAPTCGDDVEVSEELHALLTADAAAVEEEFWQHSAIRNQVIADQATGSAIYETIGN